MEYTPAAAWVTEAAKATGHQGPGNLLRVVLIVMVVGCVLVGWFLLRGYRDGGTQGSANGGAQGSANGGAQEPAASAQGPDAAPGNSPGDRNS
ncbi:hypothetical protein [Streptomyces sp. NPDC059009]|uniref:hypothetical protein n=1 Tax=Streptomyces sp. NPDC059009 TaxID=3346694 RepID=UPI0036B0E100